MNVFIIGAGGVGSFLTPALCMLIGRDKVCVIDGDTLEEKNLNRQLFSGDEVGFNKARALGEKYGCDYLAEWFSFGHRAYDQNDWLICVPDNHAARLSVLEACDYHRCCAVFAANETHSSDAYVYLPSWKGTRLDPRIMWPEIATDRSGDPRRAAVGCTGEAQEQNRQLVSANLMAAAQALHLFNLWAIELRKLGKEVIPHLPHRLAATMTRVECNLVGEK